MEVLPVGFTPIAGTTQVPSFHWLLTMLPLLSHLTDENWCVDIGSKWWMVKPQCDTTVEIRTHTMDPTSRDLTLKMARSWRVLSGRDSQFEERLGAGVPNIISRGWEPTPWGQTSQEGLGLTSASPGKPAGLLEAYGSKQPRRRGWVITPHRRTRLSLPPWEDNPVPDEKDSSWFSVCPWPSGKQGATRRSWLFCLCAFAQVLTPTLCLESPGKYSVNCIEQSKLPQM